MSKSKETIVVFCIIVFAVAIGGFLANKASQLAVSQVFNPGAAGVTLFTGSSVDGETSVTTTGTEVVARKSDRSYIQICRTNQQAGNLSQITLSINASPSHGRGIILDSTHRCFESSDLNLVTGEFNGVASPSTASVSYTQW